MYKNNGYPRMNPYVHGETVKVIKPDGSVEYKEATYWSEITHKYFRRGKTAGKGK